MLKNVFQKNSVVNIFINEDKMDGLKYTTLLNDSLFKSAVDLKLNDFLS